MSTPTPEEQVAATGDPQTEESRALDEVIRKHWVATPGELRNAILNAGFRVSSPVQVTDAMVDKAVDVLDGYGHNGIDCRPESGFWDHVRAALSAALEGER